MGTFGQGISMQLRDRIAALVERARHEPDHQSPPATLTRRDAVLVHVSPAMFAYYLGDDGTVYELDMDSTRNAEVVTSVAQIREIYEHAVRSHPELAELLAIHIVDRISPGQGLLEGFEDGVGHWNANAESREVAIARCARYFALRIQQAGPAYVVQRLPSPPNGTFLTLELAGVDPDLELELHVRWRGALTIELVHRGTRDAIAARLCADDLPATVLALEQAVIGVR